MPPVVNPVSDLARIYRQRIPTQAGQPAARSDRFGFGMATRPTGQTSSNPLGAVGRFMKTAVASLDPRFILSEGGRSVEHVVGDATELGRSVITGKDTLSQSPSARAYQAAGGGAPGVFAAAMPYANVATALIPEARLLTRSGRIAAGTDATERFMDRQLSAAINDAVPSMRPITRSAMDVGPLEPPKSRIAYYSKTSPNGSVTIVGIDPLTDDVMSTVVLEPDQQRSRYVLDALASKQPTAVLKLLSAANEIAKTQFPDTAFPLVPSRDLSAHSRPLVERLMKAGLVDPTYRLPTRVSEITFSEDQPARWARIYDKTNLTPIDGQMMSSSYNAIKAALAQSRARQAVGSTGPMERMTTPSQQLARRQRMLTENMIDNARLINVRPWPEVRQGIFNRAQSLVGGEKAQQIVSLVDDPPSQMLKDLLNYGSIEELLLSPLERFSTGAVNGYEATMLLDELTSEMGARLSAVNPRVYDMDNELTLDAIWASIADLWRDYGGDTGRQLIDLVD